MNRILLILLFVSYLIHGSFVGVANKQTYGRFGDQLLNYCKSKYMSYHYGIPFLFTPFDHSNLLQLSIKETRLNKGSIKAIMPKIGPLEIDVKAGPLLFWGTLYYKEPDWEHNLGMLGFFEFMILHPDFRQELREMIMPINKLVYFTPNTERFSIALHIRKGGGYDSELQSKQYFESGAKTHYDYVIYDKNGLRNYVKHGVRWRNFADRDKPRKFPPEQYYVDQVKKVSEYLGNIPLYVYVFTDDRSPELLMQRIQEKVNKQNIVWDCHNNNHLYKQTFLADMYSMASFDCLIRSESNFSAISQIIGNHKIIVYPIEAGWIGQQLHINFVCLIDMQKYIAGSRSIQ